MTPASLSTTFASPKRMANSPVRQLASSPRALVLFIIFHYYKTAPDDSGSTSQAAVGCELVVISVETGTDKKNEEHTVLYCMA